MVFPELAKTGLGPLSLHQTHPSLSSVESLKAARSTKGLTCVGQGLSSGKHKDERETNPQGPVTNGERIHV